MKLVGSSLFFVALAATPTLAWADALQEQVLAGARAVKDSDFAFTQAIIMEQTGSERRQFVSNYDPRRPVGARWKLVESNGKAPTVKEQAEVSKRRKDGSAPSYADILKWFGGPAKRTAVMPDKVTYFFARLPPGAIKMNNKDLSADTSAEAVVNTSAKMPFVEQVRFKSTKSFRIAVIAKIDSMTAFANYRLMPDGRPVPLNSGSDMSGSAMGKSGSMKTRSSFAGFTPVR